MAEPTTARPLTVLAPAPDRLDAALARTAGRLAAVLDTLGDAAGAAFLRALPGASEYGSAVLDLPTGATQPIDRLVAALALRPLDVDLLLLALSGHHHEGVAAILRGLHPRHLPWPTAGLAMTLVEAGTGTRDAVRATMDAGPLTAAGAITAGEGERADHPYPDWTLRAAPALWEALVGLGGWPAGVEPDPRPAPPWGLDGWLADPAVAAARAAIERSAPVAVTATTSRPAALAARLATLVRAAGREPVVLRLAPGAPVAAARIAAVARGVVPVLWSPAPVDLSPVDLAACGPLVVAAPGTGTGSRPRLPVPTGPLSTADRGAALAAALPELGPRPLPVGPASLEPGDIAAAVADLRLAAALDGLRPGATLREELAARVDAGTQDAVPVGAVLVHPVAGWDDLVLPGDRQDQLREAADRIREQDLVLSGWGFGHGRRGARGLRLLFTGPPGTGKTLAAEVLAGALGRDLLVVDLAQLVSKWIGETEKNLAAVFDAAERDGAALLFDEADALFGKRTEVGDARDRYANLETAYLLARLERFEGVAVLATNLRQNLDAAFARRIEFVVPFDQPDEAARHALWRCHLPAGAPLAPDVDLAALAALYDLPGALIRNAALAAAFLAAAGPHRQIRAEHLTHAVRREYRKAGKSFPGPPMRRGTP